MEDAKEEVLAITPELEELKDFHNQAVPASKGAIGDSREQLAGAQNRADNFEYEKDGTKAHLRQLQSGLQRYQAAVFFV